MLLREVRSHVDGSFVLATFALAASAQTPLQDIGFSPATPLPDPDAVIVREQAYGSGGIDLTAYGLDANEQFVQSIYFRFFTDNQTPSYKSFTGRVAFPPSVEIIGLITSGTLLGGANDDGQWTFSDAVFGIGADPDAYSEAARGFETGGTSGTSEYVCITSLNALVFGLNIDNGVDDFRVIIDYGDSFPADMAFDVANYDVPSFGGAVPSQGFRIGDDANPVVLGSGDFGEVGSVLRIPLTSSQPTNPGSALPSDPTHNLWILRDTSPDNYLDAFDYVFDLPEPEAVTIPGSVIGTPVGLCPGPDGHLYALAAGTGFAVIDVPSRTVIASAVLPDLAGNNTELTSIPGIRELLLVRDTSGDTFVDRFDVDALSIQTTYIIDDTVVGTPVGISVGFDGYAYVLGTGTGFGRLDLASGSVTPLLLPQPPSGSYYDLTASSSSPELFFVRSAGSGATIDRYDLTATAIQHGFAFTSTVGTAVGITEGPAGDLFLIGTGAGGAAGFARISKSTGAVIESNACMDFPGTNVDIAFVVPFLSEVYCTAKINSQGCVPLIASSGLASATNAGPFTVSASQVINNKSGILFYGLLPNGVDFQGGTLCVKQPVSRTPIQSSGGNPPPDDCSGSFAFDFNALIQSGTDPRLVPATEVFSQYWYRDSADPTGFTTGLSDGLRFTITP